jgi:hypothetical protein
LRRPLLTTSEPTTDLRYRFDCLPHSAYCGEDGSIYADLRALTREAIAQLAEAKLDLLAFDETTTAEGRAATDWARCEKCGQKLVAEHDSDDPYCLNCETCPYCHDVHHMGDRCQEATEAAAAVWASFTAQLAELREAHRNESAGLDNWRNRAERAEAQLARLREALTLADGALDWLRSEGPVIDAVEDPAYSTLRAGWIAVDAALSDTAASERWLEMHDAALLDQLGPTVIVVHEEDGSWSLALGCLPGHVGGDSTLHGAALAAGDAAEAWMEAHDSALLDEDHIAAALHAFQDPDLPAISLRQRQTAVALRAALLSSDANGEGQP